MKVHTDIYLEAVRFLGELECGEGRFELLREGLDFSNTDAVGVAVEQITGEDIRLEEKQAIDVCISGIVLPCDNNLYFEALLNTPDDHGDELSGLIRDIAFTFITAWTQRYGGFHARLVDESGTVVDPAS